MTAEHAACEGPFHYRAWGLLVRSELAVPELRPAAAEGGADVEIGFDAVPVELPGAVERGVRYQASDEAWWLQVDGVARYLARGGRQIVIERLPGGTEDDVRVLLLSTVFAAVLEQRGDLVLRGSAVGTTAGAVLFSGGPPRQ